MAVQKIVLCADDYGISPGVDVAIRHLIKLGRISATSCIVTYPDFAEEAALLMPYIGVVDVGLHINLTQRHSRTRLAIRAFSRQLSLNWVASEIDRQIFAFSRAFGRPPDFIDGHEHVHVLPTVRDAVLAAAKRLNAYVRLTNTSIWTARKRPSFLKSGLLSFLGRNLGRRARRCGVRVNEDFRGIRSFKEQVPYRVLFQKTILDIHPKTIVACHPGHSDEILRSRDIVVEPRVHEYRYLAGAKFPEDMAAAGVCLARFKELFERDNGAWAMPQ